MAHDKQLRKTMFKDPMLSDVLVLFCVNVYIIIQAYAFYFYDAGIQSCSITY